MMGISIGPGQAVRIQRPAGPAPHPDSAPAVTATLPPAATLCPVVTGTPPVALAVEFDGLSPSTGLTRESSGAGRGASLSVEGTDIVLRAGHDCTRWPASDCARIVAQCPVGDDMLVWEFADGTIRMWWNGVALGTPTGS
jgi:hypothetical protein